MCALRGRMNTARVEHQTPMNDATWLNNLIQAEPARRDETELRIIDAAYELYLTFGLRRTTLRQIAKQAGIGRPTLYRRFADKDAVTQAVFLRETRRVIRTVWDEVQDIAEPEDMLVRSFVVGIRTFNQHPLTRRLMDTEPEAILPYLTSKSAPYIELGHAVLGDLARSLRESERYRGLDTDYLLEVMGRLFTSLIVTPTRLVDVNDERKLNRFAEQFLVPLLNATKA